MRCLPDRHGRHSVSVDCKCPWPHPSVLLGGNVRVGLEDNLYLDKGVHATNAQLVERARTIVELLGVRVLGSRETRERLRFSVPA